MAELTDINSLEVLFSKNNLIFGSLKDVSRFSVQNVISGGDTTPTFIDQSSFFFDGIDDTLTSQSAFTSVDGFGYVGISLWIKIPDVSLANETIIKINNSVSGYSFLAFVRTDGRIDASCVSGSSYTRSNVGSITDNTWHHVFFRFDFSLNRYSILTIFVDGVENNSGSNFSPLVSFPNNSSTMFIANDGSTSYANCYVNELAFYTSGDDTLPSQIYNNGTANDLNTANTYEPLVWYRSEDGTWDGRGWEIPDKNENGVNLLSSNMTESSRVGDFPFAETSSFFFDGVDEYFKGSATLEALNGGVTKATFSVWIKPTQASFRYVFQNPRNTTIQHSQFAMFFDDNLRTRWSMDTQSYYIFSNINALVVDEWNHVLICVDLTQSGGADKGRVFINGVNETTSVNLTTRNQFSEAVGEFHIGEDAEGYQSSALGGIDEMAIWSGEDLRADYLTIYNQGLPVNLNNLSGISQPTNWWRSETATYPQYSTLSFNFDGVDDSFIANVVNTSAQVSVSFWFKGFGGSTSNILGGNPNGFFQYFGLLGTDSKLFIYNGGVWKALTTGTIRDNQWHHCVVTYDRNLQEVKGYRDGSLEVTLSSFVDRTDVGFQQIGRYVTAIRYLKGNLDELSMFNEVLTDSQVTDIYNGGTPNDLSSLNPFVWYRLGEGAVWDGTNWTLNDFGTNRVDATSSNMSQASRQTDFPVNTNGQFTMPSFNNAYDVLSQNMVEGSQSPNVPNFNNKSFTFDGVDDYIDCGDSNSLSFGNGTTDLPFSISAWIKIGQTTAQGIVTKYGSTSATREWLFYTTGGKLRLLLSSTNGGYNFATGTTNLLINTWYHVACTYDGRGGSTAYNGMTLYINGIAESVTTTNSIYVAMSNTSQNVEIGKHLTNELLGNIDEVAIFNSELSASQVTEIYNQGVPNDISSLNPISWWRMGENASWDGTNWTLNDLGSGSNNGTSANMSQASRTFDVPRYSQNSFEFDASLSQSLDGTTNYTLAEGRSQMTISAWVDMSNSGNSSLTYLCYVYNSVFSFGVRLQTTTSTILWFYSGTAGNNARASANLGQIKGRGWQHLLICVDLTKPNFSEVQVYLNGVAQNMNGYFTQTIFNSVSAPLIIGKYPLGATFYNGYIDEFAIWIDEDLRLQSKVDEIYNGGIPNNLNALTSVPSPTTWFRMGEQKSTWDGSKWILESLSYSTNSFTFDGVDDSIDCGSFSAYDNGDLSASIWIKKSTMGTYEYALSNSGSSAVAGFSIIFENAFRRVRVVRNTRTSDTISAYADIGFTLNTWHNIAFTYQDSTRTLKVYNDSVLQNTTIGSASTNSASLNLTIGSYQGTSNFTSGIIDEVAVFNTELSASQVTEIYNQGVPNDISTLNPLSWWRMGEDATFDGTNWTLVDNGSGGNNGTSANMSLTSKTDDVSGTYTLDSVNMVEANKSDNNPD